MSYYLVTREEITGITIYTRGLDFQKRRMQDAPDKDSRQGENRSQAANANKRSGQLHAPPSRLTASRAVERGMRSQPQAKLLIIHSDGTRGHRHEAMRRHAGA